MNVLDRVKLVKFPKFDEVDQELFEKALDHFFKKVGEDANLQLSLKQYNKGGLRIQHELRASILVDGKSFFAETTDWKLLNAIQTTLKMLQKEVKKHESMRK